MAYVLLFYLKVYPTYDLASAIFGVDKSRICRWVKELLPILESTLERSYVLPKRKVQSLQDRTYALLCKNSIWSAPHLHLKIL